MTCCRVHSVVDPAARVLRSPSMNLDVHARPNRAIAFTVATVALAVALVDQLVSVHGFPAHHDVGPMAFGVLSVLLVLSEIRPTTWTRVGERNGVTRGWAFASALVLLGTPILAITVMVATRWYVDLSRGKRALEITFNSAQIAASLSMGSLVLAVFGVHGSIARDTTMSVGECLGIVLSGLAIFGLNGILAATVIGLEQGAGFPRAARAAFELSMTADGALLALAPVFAIAAESRVVTVPLVALSIVLAVRRALGAVRHRHGRVHDPLTRLPDRSAFDRQLVAALAGIDGGGSVAVLVMDLDRFHHVNDCFGHQVGDLVLASFAQRLESVLPTTTRPARLGGDEFAALITTSTSAELPDVVGRLHELLVEHHAIDGFTLTMSVSIGVAIAPIHGHDGATLMSAARCAMDRAKLRRTGVEFGTRSYGPAPRHRSDRSNPSDGIASADGDTRRRALVAVAEAG